jgi:hypothetical protein
MYKSGIVCRECCVHFVPYFFHPNLYVYIIVLRFFAQQMHKSRVIYFLDPTLLQK